YPADVDLFRWTADWAEAKATRSRKTLADWKQFWRINETDSLQGSARYQGGNLLATAVANPAQLTPEDFRLHADSPGKGKGPGGRDLGADVDWVGPGKAYERWKKTPAYQQWLKGTGEGQAGK